MSILEDFRLCSVLSTIAITDLLPEIGLLSYAYVIPEYSSLKVLVLFQRVDSAFAIRFGKGLAAYGIQTEYYAMDYYVQEGGKALADLMKKQLPNATDVIVVLSENSKDSWWPSFVFGLASYTDKPIVSYLAAEIALPEHLSYWPRLKDPSDISDYLSTKKQKMPAAEKYWQSLPPEMQQKRRTAVFYNQLRAKLKKKYDK